MRIFMASVNKNNHLISSELLTTKITFIHLNNALGNGLPVR